jgi:hypothetical protein
LKSGFKRGDDNMTKKGMYVESGDYFPKHIRKQFGLGEFNKDNKKTTKKTTKKSK